MKRTLISKKGTGHLLPRIFMSYIIIGLIFLVTVLGSYVYIEKLLIANEVAVNEDYMNYISDSVDKELVGVKSNIYYFLQNSENGKLLNQLENVGSRVKLSEQLAQFKSSQPIIERSYVYNSQLDFVISDGGSLSKAYLFDSQLKYADLTSEEMINIINHVDGFEYLPTKEVYFDYKVGQSGSVGSGKYMITLMSAISYSSKQYKQLVMIDASKLLSAARETYLASYGEVMLVSEDGFIISSTDGGSITDTLPPAILEVVRSEDFGVSEVDSSLVIHSRSEFMDWYYCTIIQEEHIISSVRTVRNLLLLIVLGLMTILLILAVYFSRSFYRPVDRLVKKLTPKENETVVHNEFEFIMDRIQAMYDTNHVFEERTVLVKALQTGIVLDEKIMPHRDYQVVRVHSQRDLSYVMEQYAERVTKEDCVVRYIVESSKEGCFVVNRPSFEVGLTAEMMRSLSHQLKGEVAAMGIGRVYSELSDINLAYEDAQKALVYGDSSLEDMVFAYEDRTTKATVFPADFELSARQAMQQNDAHKLKELIGQIFRDNKGVSNSFMNNLVTDFINVFIRISHHLDLDFDIIDLHKFIKTEYRTDVLESFVLKIFTDSMSRLTIPEETRGNKVENFIHQYISNNYSDPNLTIEEIAGELSFTSSYVSTLFKKSSGQTFSRYLMEYRVHKAMGLLKYTSKKVKDISDEVGFGTYNNFTRAFRKITGQSPSDFRSNVKNTENK